MRPHPRDDIPALTGLRFIAAFCILVPHTVAWCVPFNDSNSLLRAAGFIGVFGMPLFFVLSGFVIHYNYGSLFSTMRWRWAISEFLSARFARIYPLFLFCFGIGAIVDGTLGWLSYNPEAFWRFAAHFLTLTQSWIFWIGVGDRNLQDNAFGLSWSISTEFFFYYNYVWLSLLILRLRRARTTLVAAAVLTVAALGLFAFLYAHGEDVLAFARANVRGVAALPNAAAMFYRWLFYYSPYSRIFEFILGCLTAQVYLLMASKPVTTAENYVGAAALALALLALEFLSWSYQTGGPTPLMAAYIQFLCMNFGCAAPIAVLIFCVSRYRSLFASWLSGPRMTALGNISYSSGSYLDRAAIHAYAAPFMLPLYHRSRRAGRVLNSHHVDAEK